MAAALAFVVALLAAPAVQAQGWGQYAVVSATLGVSDGRICIGEGSRGDIGCPTYAPYVSASTGRVGIGTTNPSATLHIAGGATKALLISDTAYSYGFGYGFGADTANMLNFWATQGSPRISFSGGALIFRSSGFSRDILALEYTGKVGIGTTRPSTTLHVSGTLRLANGGEACDGDRAGAIRYASGVFEFCAGSAWESLADVAAAGGSTPDAIVSDTTSVTANETGYISLTTGGTTTGYFDTAGRLVVPGISATTAQTSVTSLYASGDVGIGVATPSATLHIAGGDTKALLITDSAYSYGFGYGFSSDTANKLNFYAVSGSPRISFGGGALIFKSSGSSGNILALEYTGKVGIGTFLPSTTLHVSGTLRLANGGETCDANRAGAIRYNAGTFEFCAGSAWESLADVAAAGGTTPDALVSDTTRVTANETGYISLTTGGTTTGYFDTAGRLVVPGVSVTTAQTSVTSLYASGRVGIGSTGTSGTLHVSGTVFMTRYAAEPHSCTAGYAGTLAMNSNALLCSCNGTSWINAATGAACTW